MTTLSLDAFWTWLLDHPNCLVRAGSSNALLCDDEDFHWWIGADNNVLITQLIRGKRLVGEILIDPERVAYVDDRGEQQEGEHLFELITETENERLVDYFFVLTHGFEVEQEDAHSGAVH